METSVSFFLFCQLKPLLPSALGGGLGRPRRSGIPSPEGEENEKFSPQSFALRFGIFNSVEKTKRYTTGAVYLVGWLG